METAERGILSPPEEATREHLSHGHTDINLARLQRKVERQKAHINRQTLTIQHLKRNIQKLKAEQGDGLIDALARFIKTRVEPEPQEPGGDERIARYLRGERDLEADPCVQMFLERVKEADGRQLSNIQNLLERDFTTEEAAEITFSIRAGRGIRKFPTPAQKPNSITGHLHDSEGRCWFITGKSLQEVVEKLTDLHIDKIIDTDTYLEHKASAFQACQEVNLPEYRG